MAYESDRSMITYAPPPPATTGLVGTPPRAKICFLDIDRPVPEWAISLRKSGATVFADLGWDPTEAWSAEVLDRLEHVDVFLPNAVEAMAYTRTGSPEEALEARAERLPVVVIKLGERGAIAIDSTTGERASAAALPVSAVDPTGAGDVFAAGFVFGTLAEWPLAQRLRFANLCAGLSVRHLSGSLGAPCWGEIATFGEDTEVPGEVLSDYSFIVPYIPQSGLDEGAHVVARAQPTLRHTD
jgi:sugar/nucleoside kinase (ribokinase family)